MRFVRFEYPGRGPSLGVVRDGPEEGVADLTALDPLRFASPLPWLRGLARGGLPAQEVGQALERALAVAPRVATLAELEASLALLPPVAAPEVWAAGVTYARSRDARDQEARTAPGGEAHSAYDRVYAAERPELFFKATGDRLRGPGSPVGLRGDSRWQVPEPELALVLDEDGSVLGYTLGNDLSCRDIEGENPLYLPQAKIFRNSCALGPTVLAADEAAAAAGFPVACTVWRASVAVWTAETHTAQMRRSFAELAGYLLRHNWLPAGSVLLTGTGVVPPDDFTLRPGDEICISSPAIGTLRNIARTV